MALSGEIAHRENSLEGVVSYSAGIIEGVFGGSREVSVGSRSHEMLIDRNSMEDYSNYCMTRYKAFINIFLSPPFFPL